MNRLVVFMDYQNVYMLARRAFAYHHDPSQVGQIHPDLVGLLLRARREQVDPDNNELSEVRVYRGLPDGALDPKGHGAATKQIAHWEGRPDVRAFWHPLAYPRGWEVEEDRPAIRQRGEKPREKGIDVQIAVDVVLGAVNDEYDVGIVFSGDSDLLPAIRAAMSLGKHVEVAAWGHHLRPATRIPGTKLPARSNGSPRKLWCHFLSIDDFEFCRDDTNYVL